MLSAVEQFVTTNTRSVVLAAVVVALYVIYKFATRAMKRYILGHATRQDNAQNFLLMWRYVWLAVIVIFILVAFSGSIAGLGISAAFLGLIMGWSLQAPVTGLAAWLMIIVKRPFRIGDRVIISGITGDVVDITLTHVILNQVGGTIGGEERSGRGVLIPNATLFSQIIYNYTSESRYLLDEVLVPITFDSDLAAAEQISLDAAREVTARVIERTREEPFVRVEIMDNGVRLRLRYKAEAKDRQRVTSDITRIIVKKIGEAPKVSFAYPHMEIIYQNSKR